MNEIVDNQNRFHFVWFSMGHILWTPRQYKVQVESKNCKSRNRRRNRWPVVCSRIYIFKLYHRFIITQNSFFDDYWFTGQVSKYKVIVIHELVVVQRHIWICRHNDALRGLYARFQSVGLIGFYVTHQHDWKTLKKKFKN